ncbi:MAG TPA: ABC transporter permease [Jatrophihabitans sp.]|nr:ABC transporter permease [Jatrophihabitans sp.]
MSNATYYRTEIQRIFRNRQNFLFSLLLPFVLYLFIAGNNRTARIGELSLPTYFMAGMIAFGGMGAVMGGGARIALEREQGWTRQLRISPLTSRTYFSGKLLGCYLTAACTIGLMYAGGVALGVRMPVGRWIEMTALILLSLVPFAALGIMLGHLVKADAMGPAMGGGMSLLSIFGGAFGEIGGPGSWVHGISEFVPSYWTVQAGHVAVGGDAWGARGWLTTAAWSALTIYGAVWAYRRDTGRA